MSYSLFPVFGNGAYSEILGKINRDIQTPTVLCSLSYPTLINAKRVISTGPDIFFIEIPVPSQERERPMYLCARGIDYACSTIFLLDFGTVPTICFLLLIDVFLYLFNYYIVVWFTLFFFYVISSSLWRFYDFVTYFPSSSFKTQLKAMYQLLFFFNL